ncbi:hypothetical protein M9Y10_029106 [Tritrichomonas musculus]|uniref:Uncharacterized protein n=1 Tax=Tritrichomonas musculus TaxID=1915356 RepID=A0ABR2KL83_9EUKA
MNVRGFNAEGEMTELRVAAQNKSLVALSNRFTKAMSCFPSFETENALKQIMSEIQDTEHAKVVKFQCEREIAKCLINRQEYSEAITYLIRSLKTDESRADIWTQLAICAQKTNNANLFRAANSRIRKLRPQMEINIEVPQLPNFVIPDEQPKFSGYKLQTPCWTAYLRLLNEAVSKCPYHILEIVFEQAQITQSKAPNYDLGHPMHIRHQPVSSVSKQGVKTLGGITLIDFFQKLIVKHTESTWLFSEPVISLCATTINEIAEFPFKNDSVPKDIAILLIDIALKYCFNDLVPPTKLFLAELASEVQPNKCNVFLRDIDSANLHSQNALLRFSFATLQESIRRNLDYSIIESQLSACEKNLDKDLCLTHAGIVINKELLEKKKEQIRILKMISTRSATDVDPISLFENELLSFLSLTNIIKLFMQLDNNSMIAVFPSFLKLLPNLIAKNQSEIDGLSQIFNKITEPLEKDSIERLNKSFNTLNEIGADKNLIFSCALAIARSSINYEDRPRMLVKVHKVLGKYSVCCNNNGKFLEYLMDSLLPRSDEFENDLTSAFTCYFGDVPICNINHHSTLKFRCSKYVQPFVDHVFRYDSKSSIQQHLFVTYLAIWKHSKGDCNCISRFNGWQMYRVIKKKESQLSKSELPEGYTPQSVLEDLLRHDPENTPESRVALGKVLIRSFISAPDPNKNTLNEAIQLLSCDDSSPSLMLMNAIAHALLGDDINGTIKMLVNLPVFEKPKKEARKLYWTIRLMLSTGQRERAKEAAAASFQLKSKFNSEHLSYALYLLCIAADVFQEKKKYQEIISQYCKSRILSPYPFIGLAKMLPPKEANDVISKLVRPNSVNITSFFHFDFKPPFLMAKPDDITSVRHDVLQLFVDSAAASGNYQKLFGLFNPSMKLDRKASKVLSKNRIIYGIDRLDVFAKYIKELLKVLVQKGDKIKNDLMERAIDALARGAQVELTDNLKEPLEELFNYLWKRQTGNDPPPEASVNELINMIMGRDEEEDEEEDADFVDESNNEDNDDKEKELGEKSPTKRTRVDIEEAVEDDEDDEVEVEEADEEEEEAEFEEDDNE